MAVFKCKMCGGALEVEENQTVATCDYCGTQQTLPKLNDEKIANLYDRANHFRRNNEFDKAMVNFAKEGRIHKAKPEYMMGKEVEVDAICDGKDILIPGIMEHLERAGVHSGDSMSIYPPYSLSKEVIDTIVDYTTRIGIKLKMIGLFNIQFIVDSKNNVYIIEVNPRSSRTVPYISKVTNLPMIDIATKVILGKKLKDLGVKGENVLVIGDGRAEIQAGVQMGAFVVSRLPENADFQRELHKKLGTNIIIKDFCDKEFLQLFKGE